MQIGADSNILSSLPSLMNSIIHLLALRLFINLDDSDGPKIVGDAVLGCFGREPLRGQTTKNINSVIIIVYAKQSIVFDDVELMLISLRKSTHSDVDRVRGRQLERIGVLWSRSDRMQGHAWKDLQTRPEG